MAALNNSGCLQPLGNPGSCTSSRRQCRCGVLRHLAGIGARWRLAGADPVVLLPVVGGASAPLVGMTARLEPEVLAGRNEVGVILVNVLPPAVVRSHVGLGLALPVDDNLYTAKPTRTDTAGKRQSVAGRGTETRCAACGSYGQLWDEDVAFRVGFWQQRLHARRNRVKINVRSCGRSSGC